MSWSWTEKPNHKVSTEYKTIHLRFEKCKALCIYDNEADGNCVAITMLQVADGVAVDCKLKGTQSLVTKTGHNTWILN